jgi:(S)-2-hydroxyglutarate dehydrogenase
MSERRIVVVGGGVVGLATAWRILERAPEVQLTLVEKEPGVGRHQTGNNSGVLHCGLHYRTGSRKAKLAVRGIRQMTAFCRDHAIAHDICGNLVVATSGEQIPRLNSLLERGTANGLTGLKIVSPEEMREIEPHAGGVAGLLVPEEGIVDYPAVCEALKSEIEQRVGKVVLNAGVRKLVRSAREWRVETLAGEFAADVVVTCAGLQADRVARLGGVRPEVKIVAFRGDYYRLRPEREFLVRNLIYPVADPKFPFLGVHFTRMVRGGIEAGPNAVLSLDREGYGRMDMNLRDAADALTFPGLWRFLGKHFSTCMDEVHRAFSRALFCGSLQKLVPELREDDLVKGGSGVRAQAMRPDGALVEDFEYIVHDRAVHVLNAPSPAATASLAIGEEIAELALAQ